MSDNDRNVYIFGFLTLLLITILLLWSNQAQAGPIGGLGIVMKPQPKTDPTWILHEAHGMTCVCWFDSQAGKHFECSADLNTLTPFWRVGQPRCLPVDQLMRPQLLRQ